MVQRDISTPYYGERKRQPTFEGFAKCGPLHTSCDQEILLNGIELATFVSNAKFSGCHPAEVACGHRCYIIPQFVNDATQMLAISRDIELCVGRHNESRVSSRLDPYLVQDNTHKYIGWNNGIRGFDIFGWRI